MRTHHIFTFVLGAVASTTGCHESPTETGDVVSSQSPIIYGSDDRTEVYAHPNAALRAIAQDSVASLLVADRVDYSDPMNVTLEGRPHGEVESLCPGERFFDQHDVSGCAAFLIDNDLMLTDGSCLDADACPDARVVFNRYYTDATTRETITVQDVYACRSVVARERTGDRADWYSEQVRYTVFQLDRPALRADGSGGLVPRTFPPVRTEASSVAIASNVHHIGTPRGLPIKIDDNGFVLYSRPPLLDFFGTSNDIFASGGSPAFDTTGTVIGIASFAGSPDYVDGGGCNVVNTEPMSGPTGGRAADFVYAHRAIEGLCATPFPSPLCGRAASCGDGVCSGLETYVDCAMDCAAPVCGDDVCHPDEAGTCADCGVATPPPGPPAGWTCAPGAYDAVDGCNCGCGVPDPDCDVMPIPAFGCATDERCSAGGVCEPDPSAPSVPGGWMCIVDFYESGMECNCGCGAPDPDCNDASLEVVGCNPGQACVAGECADLATDAGAPPPASDAGPMSMPPPDEEDGGCSVGGRRARGLPWLLALAFVALATGRARARR